MMQQKIPFRLVVIALTFCTGSMTFAQGDGGPSSFEQSFFFGNKVAWGKDKMKYSGELQFRLNENATSLDNWYVEGAASFMPSKHWEMVPDLRISTHPESMEVRPGFGILRKDLWTGSKGNSHQFVNQLKYQADFKPGSMSSGLRYILFYNYLLNEKIILTGVGGVFYSWKENFTGLEFIRAGGGMAYVFNRQHSLNLLYFTGIADSGDSWIYQGNIILQLIINVTKEYKYVPAKYISF